MLLIRGVLSLSLFGVAVGGPATVQVAPVNGACGSANRQPQFVILGAQLVQHLP